jgi:nicotinate-nucleotide pyrophosphorylase (carboxylating)
MKLSKTHVRRVIRDSLAEDLQGLGDVTSKALIPAHSMCRVRILSRASGVLAGVDIAAETFKFLGRTSVKRKIKDRTQVSRGEVVLELEMKTRAALAGERTALNFLQRLSGIATLTHRFVQAARRANRSVRILDTRKTTPLLRALEKYAVTCGGGFNHRFGLFDRVLIKDNHIAAVAARSARPVHDAIWLARRKHPELLIEVECDTLAQVREAITAGPDIILLDNMSPADMKKAVAMTRGLLNLEASGGITLATVAAFARTGVDFISVGALTHSAPALDLSMEIQPLARK